MSSAVCFFLHHHRRNVPVLHSCCLSFITPAPWSGRDAMHVAISPIRALRRLPWYLVCAPLRWCESPTGWNSFVNDLCPFQAPGAILGAGGQPGSMAAGNKKMVSLHSDFAQVLSGHSFFTEVTREDERGEFDLIWESGLNSSPSGSPGESTGRIPSTFRRLRRR